MTFRSKHWSVLAVLAAALLAVAGLTSPASALTARTLTIKASPVYQYGGKPVTFSGSVTKSPKGSVIKIQRKSGTTWVAAGQTKTTTAGGAYAVALNVPATAAKYSYRALAPKTTKLAGVFSTKTVAVTVLRPTTATLTITPSSVSVGANATFAGTVSPFTTGEVVALQRLSGSSWVGVGSANVASNGSFTLGSAAPTTAGTYSYRVQTPLNGLNAGSVSASKTLTVANPDAPVITTTSLPDGDQNLPYSATLNKTGDAGTWSIPAGTLPGGITLNADTGVLSGTPTGSGSRTLSVTFTETASGLKAVKNIPITIKPGPSITTTSPLPTATQGSPYSVTLAKTGRAGTWSLLAALPAGLTLNSATGEISGIPTVAAGDYGIYPKFTETDGGRTAQAALALHVNAASSTPTISTTSLPDATQGVAYTTTVQKTGAAGTWSATGLPNGLSIDPATGVISGTTNAAPGDNAVVLKYTETASTLSATKTLNLHVNAPTGPTISTTSLPSATQGVAYSTTLAKTGGAGTWSATGLPSGLSVNADTGVISGATSAAVGDYPVVVKYTETTGGLFAQKTLTLHVNAAAANAPVITTTSLPDGDEDLAYTATLTKTGNAGTWSIPAGTLPTGITLNADTGVLSGTPTGSGSRNLFVTFTETASGLSASKVLPLTIKPGPVITTTSLPDATRGAAYSVTLQHTGGAGTWTTRAALPAGLTLNADTGVLSGTPTAIGDFGVYPTFTETATGRTALVNLGLHVGGTALAITTDTTLPDGHKSLPYTVTFAKTGGAGTWSSTTLPNGLTLNPTTGVLSGTPTVAQISAFYVTFTETATGQDVTKLFGLTVSGPKVTTTSIPDGVTGTAYSVQFTKTGLAGTWDLNGVLPDGLGFTSAGLLSGTPTETGEFGLVVTFTETATGETSKQGYVLHVEAPGSPDITTTSLPNGKVGTPYSATLAATPTGGTWAITSGSLPVGLSLNAATGEISGTPGFPENATFVVTYTKGSTHNTKYLSLIVPAPAG